MPTVSNSVNTAKAGVPTVHVGALSYASSFQSDSNSRIVICKIDPADVVCVPYDASQQKMRVCEYLVVGEHGAELPSEVLDDLDEAVVEEVTRAEAESATSNVSDEPDFDEDEDEDEEGDEDAKHEADADEHEEAVVVKPTKAKAKNPKKPSKQKAKAKAKKPAKTKAVKAKVERPTKATVQRTSHKFDKLSDIELFDIGIRELREYAAKSLRITGVGHLPGGKVALIAKISDVRTRDTADNP